MRLPDSEQIWRYGSTLGVLVSLGGLWGSLSGVGVPVWVLWAGLLALCGVTAIRMWPEHLDRARDRREALNRIPTKAFVDPRAKASDDDDPGV